MNGLRQLLPPTRGWALLEAGAVLLLLGWILFAPEVPTESVASPPSPRAAPENPMPEEIRERIRAAFPTGTSRTRRPAWLFAQVAEALDRLGLSLESRSAEPPLSEGRERVRFEVRGDATAEVAFLRFLLRDSLQVRVTGFRWSEGGGPGQRLFTVDLEMPAEREG